MGLEEFLGGYKIILSQLSLIALGIALLAGIFASAVCPACEEAVALVNRIACPCCNVTVLDMKDPKVASRAKSLGIRSVPAVLVDGNSAECCAGRGPNEAVLTAAGIGQPH